MKDTPFFRTLSVVAPSMVGTARTNENSAAAPRDNPSNIAPMIVAAEREVPGKSARHWKQPMAKANGHASACRLVTRGSALRRSSTTNATPPTKSAMATGRGLSRCASMRSSKAKPKTAEGTNAIAVSTQTRKIPKVRAP